MVGWQASVRIGLTRWILVGCLALGVAHPSVGFAAELVAGGDWQLRWDNTVKLSAAWRVQEASPSLLAGINADDGDRDFDRGFISARIDLFSELDFTYRVFGLRISGAGWFDLIYNLPTDNESYATVNAWSRDPTRFTNATRNLHGRYIELLDGFGFVNTDVKGLPVSLRAGRHTLLWGESLLMADNGISNAQAPIDAIKALSVPATPAKELFMPVNQISGQLGPWKTLTLAAFYQLEWRRTRIPAAGSYFSSADILDAGGQRLLLMMGENALFRGDDMAPSPLGQWGASLRWSAEALDADLGLYYIRYSDKTPQVYLLPGFRVDPVYEKVGEYVLAFQEGIQLVGASFTTTVGDMALAGEAHVRFGTPLASIPQSIIVGEVEGDNDQHPLYALGNTFHAQVSGVYVFAPSPLWASASLAAELGLQQRLAFTRNEAAFDPQREATAWGFRFIFTPAYFQVRPNLDLSLPLSFAYNPMGKSSIAGFNGGADKGGNFSVGISGEYLKLWLANLQFVYYFGDDVYQPRNDRGFISVALQRTF